MTLKNPLTQAPKQSSTGDLGLIYIFTGDGKGKTSAALGTMLRALAHGWRVGWISWYKEPSWGISEHDFPQILTAVARKRLHFFPLGKGFYIAGVGDHTVSKQLGKKAVRANSAVIVDKESANSHTIAAQDALQVATSLLATVDVLFLDEVCNAVADNLLSVAQVLDLLAQRKSTHVILTGRSAAAELIAKADLVSEILSRKHPFDTGKLAVKGLDF